MNKRNVVYVGRSLDGFIADKKGGLDWLDMVPNPDNLDMGYFKFFESIDALVMGRTTFETVCGFDCDWPYKKPVFVLSSSLKTVPEDYKDKIELVNGTLTEVLATIHGKGFGSLYIDGGKTVQSFLKEDLIDELIITTIPILLGGGIPLFTELPHSLEFEHVGSEVFLNEIVQNHYKRRREPL